VYHVQRTYGTIKITIYGSKNAMMQEQLIIMSIDDDISNDVIFLLIRTKGGCCTPHRYIIMTSYGVVGIVHTITAMSYFLL